MTVTPRRFSVIDDPQGTRPVPGSVRVAFKAAMPAPKTKAYAKAV